jgi:hypothetical protein
VKLTCSFLLDALQTWFMARLNALKGTPTGSSSVNGLASPSVSHFCFSYHISFAAAATVSYADFVILPLSSQPQDTLNPRLEEPVDADAQLPLTRAMSA